MAQQGRYSQLLPSHLENDVRMTIQPIKFCQLFGFQHMIGVGITRRLYFLSMIFNTAFWFIVMIDSLAYGIEHSSAVTAIAALIICPLAWLIWSYTIRVLCELAVVVLTLPATLGGTNQQPMGLPSAMHNTTAASNIHGTEMNNRNAMPITTAEVTRQEEIGLSINNSNDSRKGGIADV
ncbi:unnamed protein product [Heterosigma akashiwo]